MWTSKCLNLLSCSGGEDWIESTATDNVYTLDVQPFKLKNIENKLAVNALCA